MCLLGKDIFSGGTGALGNWILFFFLPWFLSAVSPECSVRLCLQIGGREWQVQW